LDLLFEGLKVMPRKAKSAAAKAKNSGSGAKIRIQYYRSFIATPKTHKQMVRSLGLTKLNQIVERPDNDSMRGAVAKIPHLLRIVEE
jgi:large subunit ribosomal protein L30